MFVLLNIMRFDKKNLHLADFIFAQIKLLWQFLNLRDKNTVFQNKDLQFVKTKIFFTYQFQFNTFYRTMGIIYLSYRLHMSMHKYYVECLKRMSWWHQYLGIMSISLKYHHYNFKTGILLINTYN